MERFNIYDDRGQTEKDAELIRDSATANLDELPPMETNAELSRRLRREQKKDQRQSHKAYQIRLKAQIRALGQK